MMSLKLGGTQDPIIYVAHPSEYLRTIFGEAFDIGLAQKFIWYPGFVLFFPPGRLGSYWVEIYTSSKLEIQAETIRAIAVPFTVSSFNRVSVACKDDLRATLYINEGNYQLLFEARYLTADEASQLAGFDWYNDMRDENLQKFAPELIRITFIPAVKLLKAQILRAESGFNPPQNLYLNSSYKKPSYQTDVPLVTSSHLPPVTLEFISIAENTLREFYKTNRIYFQIHRESLFGSPDNSLWIDVYNIPPILNPWESSLSISINRNGHIAIGGILWEEYRALLKIWQLELTSEGEFSWFYLYEPGLIHQDAAKLQQLLLILEEKAKIHFQSTL